jgi:hypothetical protein
VFGLWVRCRERRRASVDASLPRASSSSGVGARALTCQAPEAERLRPVSGKLILGYGERHMCWECKIHLQLHLLLDLSIIWIARVAKVAETYHSERR